MFENYASAGEDDDEAAFGATQCLETVATVLEVIKDNEGAIAAVEEILSPLVYRCVLCAPLLPVFCEGVKSWQLMRLACCH